MDSVKGFVGRKEEIRLLEHGIAEASAGRGGAVVITGRAGMGKSVLASHFETVASGKGFNVLKGASDAFGLRPFRIFSEVLASIGEEDLLSDMEYTGFTKVFAIGRTGSLIADASPLEDSGMESGLFAGMLSAVQNFVRDSFNTSGNRSAGLGRLEYGNLKIIIEHGQKIFLAGVVRGDEHSDMRSRLRHALMKIEAEQGRTIAESGGAAEATEQASPILKSIAETRFLVKKDLEGIKLEAERLRIADSALGLFTAKSCEKPLAIILEDLQWADEPSLFLMSYLARNIAERKIIILSTMRADENSKIEGPVQKIVEDGYCTQIPLKGLESGEIRELFKNELGKYDMPGDFMDGLEKKCEGNPFFIREILSQMVQDSAISEVDGLMILRRANYNLPESIEDLVLRKLDRLEPRVIAVAEYLSCIGSEFDTALLNSTDMLASPEEGLAALEDARIISVGPGRGRFSQAFFREVIYSGINQRWLTIYHRNIGEIYERNYDMHRVIYELARHFYMSRDYDKGFEYCIRAGESAEGSYAMEKAAEFYQDALACLGGKQDDAERQAKEAELCLRIGETLLLSSALDESLAAFEKMANSAGDDSLKVLAHRKMAMVHEKKGNYTEALAQTETGMRLAGRDSPEYWKLEIQNATIFSRTGKFKEGIESCEQAIEALGSLPGNDKELGMACNTMGMCHWYLGNFDSAFSAYERCLAINEKIHDYYGISAVHNNLGILFQVRGELDEALEQQKKGLAIRQRIKDHMGIAASMNNIGLIYYDLGRYDEALEMQLGGLEIRRRIGHQAGLALSYTNLGEIYKMKGELDKAVENHMKCLALKEAMGDKWGIANANNNLGIAYNEKGDHRLALGHYETSINICTDIDAKEFLIHAQLGKAEALVSLGSFGEAAKIASEMETLSSELGIKRSIYDAWLINGRAMSGEKAREKAAELFDKAEAGFGELKSRIDVAHVKYYRGKMYKEMDKPDLARENIEQAKEIYEALGIRHWSDKCDPVLVGLRRS